VQVDVVESHVPKKLTVQVDELSTNVDDCAEALGNNVREVDTRNSIANETLKIVGKASFVLMGI
jgi:hypothetical protein